MKNLRNLFVFALFFVTMMSCQKDQEIATDNIDTTTIATETGSNHIHSNGKKCASKSHMAEKLQDVAFKKSYEQSVQSFARGMKNNVANSRAACSSPTILPVAIHYQGVNNPNKACLTEIAKRQIAIVNADFQGSNSDIVQWKNTASAAFPGINNGSACLEFQIATKNHPAGYNLSDGDLAITYNQTNGDQINKWSGYINIIVNDGDGALGYAPFGGNGKGDGVVIAYGAFGNGSGCGKVTPQAPNDLGRTLTHELGHYLYLDHVWGENESCNNDDGVSDTPNQARSSFGCPGLNSVSSCGNKSLHMNYMDYTDDPCMYMFTAGQVARMESWVNTSGLKNNLKTNVLGTGGTTVDTGGNTECSTPTGLSVQAVSATSFVATWNTGTDVQLYQLQYRESGTTTWTTKNATTTSLTITSLKSDTNYQYRVRARCQDGTWVAFTGIGTVVIPNGTDTGGNTDDICSTPTGLSVQAASATSFVATWNVGTDVLRYQLKYRESGTTTWRTKNTTTTSVTIPNLKSGKNYQYRLRIRCQNGTWTKFTSIGTVAIPNATDTGNDSSTSKITLKVTLDDYGSETTFAIEDGSGNVVKSWGPFGDGRAGAIITRNIDLPTGGYTFVIFDDYGDGICCSEGAGNWKILKDGVQIKSSNGQFGYWEEYDFTVGSARLSGPAHRVDAKDEAALAKKQKPAMKVAFTEK